jgi:C1A family cysteine protease
MEQLMTDDIELRPHQIRKFGWIPDLPDARDHMYAAPIAHLTALPLKMDLRPQCPKTVYDQGELGSCTGNAIAGAIHFDRLKQTLTPDFVPSRLFIYYNERVIEHTVETDSGAMIRDGIKSVAKKGVCPEDDWPYDISKFTRKPSAKSYKHALKTRAISYYRVVQSLTQLKGCLSSGYPFVFGFSVYESFESEQVSKTGVVPMPDLARENLLGGHAVLAVGYDDADQRFIVRNSWGSKWGMAGYFTMPYAYLIDSNFADDFWTIRTVSPAGES